MSCTRYASMKSLRARLVAGDEPEWLKKHSRRSYIVQAVLASPPWVDMNGLYKLRDEARRLSQFTGIEHNLDHVVPLNHPRVCGLNVPWNLRVVPKHCNARKSNVFYPEQHHLRLGEPQGDLFQLDAESPEAVLEPIETRLLRGVDDFERRNGQIVQKLHHEKRPPKHSAHYYRRKRPCLST